MLFVSFTGCFFFVFFITVIDVVIVSGVLELEPPFLLVVTSCGFSINMCVAHWKQISDMTKNVESLINSVLTLCRNTTFSFTV